MSQCQASPWEGPLQSTGLGLVCRTRTSPSKAQPAQHWAEALCSLQGSQFLTCTVQDQGAAAAWCCRAVLGGPCGTTTTSIPWGADGMSASHPNSPMQGSWPSSICPLQGQNCPRTIVSEYQGFQAPHPPPAQGSCTRGGLRGAAGGLAWAEGRLATLAPSTRAVKAPCPAAGTRPSPQNAGARETVATAG